MVLLQRAISKEGSKDRRLSPPIVFISGTSGANSPLIRHCSAENHLSIQAMTRVALTVLVCLERVVVL